LALVVGFTSLLAGSCGSVAAKTQPNPDGGDGSVGGAAVWDSPSAKWDVSLWSD
jgi:hypothetical protein